jgi:hypothetical protein
MSALGGKADVSLAAPFLAAWVATKNAGARTRAKLVTVRTKICVLRFRSLRRRLKIHAASFAGQTLKLLRAHHLERDVYSSFALVVRKFGFRFLPEMKFHPP